MPSERAPNTPYDFLLIQLGVGQIGAAVVSLVQQLTTGWSERSGLSVHYYALADSSGFAVPGPKERLLPAQLLTSIAEAHIGGQSLRTLPNGRPAGDWHVVLDQAIQAGGRPNRIIVVDCAVGHDTTDLLLEYGFRYESSLMADDFTPHWCRVGDVPNTDSAYVFGQPVDLVEMPVSWVLDDFPHFEFLRYPNVVFPGLSAPSKVEEIWKGEFTFMYRDVPNGIYTLTMHPEIIGKGHRIMMLERLIDWMADHEGVVFTRLEDAAEQWRDEQSA